MHQALYRKWRPTTFTEVCGQEHVTSILKYEVGHGLVSHAYLFCGSRGTGKTSCAKILAKAVNCESPSDGNPCGICPSCRAIADGRTTDVLEMDAASNNRVDDIRTILDEVMFTPGSLKYRVYIIDEVHMLSQSAFNALLKTLEEPPAHVIFILATTEIQKLPATIISRCQRFDFRRLPTAVLTARLKQISEAENIDLDNDAALILARLAEGGMRDAISLLELCSAGGGKVDAARVAAASGWSGRMRTSAFFRAIAGRDVKKLFEMIAETDSSAGDITVFWQELIAYYRDLMVMKTAGPAQAASYLDLTDSERETLEADAALLTREAISYQCRKLNETLTLMQRPGVSRRVQAELAAIRLCDVRLDSSPEAILSRIAALENKSFTVASPSPVETRQVPETAGERNAKKKEKAPAASAPEQPETQKTAGNPEKPAAPSRMRNWPDVLDILRPASPGVAALLASSAAYVGSEGGRTAVTIRYKTEVTRMLASAPETLEKLCAALSTVTGANILPANVSFEPGVPEDDKPSDELLDEIGRLVN